MARFSTQYDKWTDDEPCKLVAKGTKLFDAKGKEIVDWIYAETHSGLVAFASETPNPHPIYWRVHIVPLKIDED